MNGRAALGGRLAQKYKSLHAQMVGNSEDICPRGIVLLTEVYSAQFPTAALAGIPGQNQVLGEFQWNKTFPWPTAPDALLVQTGCCYEERGSGHLYAENRDSVVAAMKER